MLAADAVIANALSALNAYIFEPGSALLANTMYVIEVSFVQTVANDVLFNDPISMLTMSTTDISIAIIYDFNNSLFHLYIPPAVITETIMVGVQLDSRPQDEFVTDPGESFSAFIDITPTVSSSEGERAIDDVCLTVELLFNLFLPSADP